MNLGLAHAPGRCAHGYAAEQHPHFCACSTPGVSDEHSTFVAALRTARREDGTVHVNDVRPLVRGRIAPKHIGTLWRRAVAERLITFVGWEDSTDAVGRNADKKSRVYRWTADTG